MKNKSLFHVFFYMNKRLASTNGRKLPSKRLVFILLWEWRLYHFASTYLPLHQFQGGSKVETLWIVSTMYKLLYISNLTVISRPKVEAMVNSHSVVYWVSWQIKEFNRVLTCPYSRLFVQALVCNRKDFEENVSFFTITYLHSSSI